MPETVVTVNDEPVVEVIDETEPEEKDVLTWLKDAIIETRTEIASLSNSIRMTLEAQQTAQITAMEESRTLIASLTQMVTEQSRNLSTIATAIAVSSMSRLTQTNSENTLPETEVTVSPESVAEENPAARTQPEERKRRKL